MVDGSFNTKTGVYGGGVAVYDSAKNLLDTRRISGNKPEFAQSRNVAGEVMAYATAISMAVERRLPAITVVCDYEGIVRWSAPKTVVVRGQACWGSGGDTPISDYIRRVLTYAKQHGVNHIHLIWVRSHTGVKVNDLVDQLAKEAVGVS